MPDLHQQQSVGVFGQTALLFKKNFLSKIRQEPKILVGEILVPILYLALLCYLVTRSDVKTYPSVTQSSPNEIRNVLDGLNLSLGPFIEAHIVPDTPDVKNFTEVMNVIRGKTGKTLTFVFHPTETDLQDAFQSGKVNSAIVFATTAEGKVAFNSYTIRVNPDRLPWAVSAKKVGLETCRAVEIHEKPEEPGSCPVNSYYYSQFLALQSLVDQADLERKIVGATVDLKIEFENYPKAEYNAGIATFLRVLIPLYSVIPLSQLINNILVLTVTEKEAKIKDGLKMIGVSDAAYWLSWFGVYSIIIFFFSLMFTIVMYFFKVLYNLNPIILFLLFLLFGFSVITLAFAITPFFHKPKTAGVVGALVLQLMSLLFIVQAFVDNSATKTALIPLRLISSLAFTTALEVATANEYTGGIGWTDLTFGGRGEGIFISLLFLIFEIFFYALLAIYLDNVIPNQFCVRKHPLFCFMPSYWVGKEKRRTSKYSDDGRPINNAGVFAAADWGETSDDIEPISPNLIGKEAILIRHINKTYFPSWIQPKTKTVEAVKDISLNIYEGQITAILGRNGAGKSTLFNMLIGLVTPTSGGSQVFGLDVSDPYDMNKLRKMIGVCLQFDLHFSALTVEEHLQLYGKLRGLSKAELGVEIDTILTDLRLKEKRNTQAAKLSGGQKRKLSLGIALIGDPKIILLDEPTSGVDVVSRRHLWDLLQRNKNGKVILLTTHFMDEADILADRKVVIHDGEIKCIGSSLFLKNRFGVGYYLTVELNDQNSSAEECDGLISKWLPSALNSKKAIGNELKYSLPHTEVSKFPSLFLSLEEMKERSQKSPGEGIKSFGVSMTTLEEVFLKISGEPTADRIGQTGETAQNSNGGSSGGNYGASDEQNLIGDFGQIRVRPAQVFLALCKLRIRRLYRSPQSVFFMVFMPLIMAAIGMHLVKIFVAKAEDVSLVLTDPRAIYSTSELNLALHDENTSGKLEQYLKQAGFIIHQFNGNFSSLLKLNQPVGTMSAISVTEFFNLADRKSLHAHLMINGTFVHSTPILAAALKSYFESEFNLKDPIPFKLSSRPFLAENSSSFDVSSIYVIFLIGPAFVFIAVGMVIEIVYDREIRARNHLRVNGLSFKMYFFSIFIVFGTLAMFVTGMQLSLIAIFNVKAYANPYAFTVITVLLLLFIPPSLLFSALFSYLFNKMESAQSVFSQVASWSGMIAALVIAILDFAKYSSSVVTLVHSIFSILNIFYIPFGVFYYVNKQYFECSRRITCDSLDFTNYTGSEFYIMLFALLGQIPVFLLLLVIADVLKDGGSVTAAFKNISRFKRVAPSPTDSADTRPDRVGSPPALNLLDLEREDEDVTRETIRVNNYFSNTLSDPICVMAVQNVVKQYSVKTGKGKEKKKQMKNVVNHLNLMVDEGEVFGLLGHNGAGKTTLIKLITAEENPNDGKVKLCGMDLRSNMSKAFQQLGYCPQHDALWENITLKEHLELYCAIRGVQPRNHERLVNHFLFGLMINEHAEKRAGDLSGGTKRKLSYALSMLGTPKVVLLDEPSTGMDPQSKRFLWNTVLGTFKDSRGAMLTTHSMEEADALCTRIAIMVKGSILCVGSPQHLKTKFGAGYTLEIKLKTSDTPESAAVHVERAGTAHLIGAGSIVHPEDELPFAFVKDSFPGAIMSESFGNRAIFSVPTTSVQSISKAFSLLEELKQNQEIEEYSFSQTTLEQIFLAFAKENDENEEE